MKSGMTAEAIGRAAKADLQLAVPERPVVRRGVRLRPVDDAILVDGSPRTHAFRGAFARTHLLALAEACDGERDHAAVAAHLGLDEQVVFKAVALLWTAGVVEEEPTSGEATPSVTSEFACLLSRLGDSTGANPSWQAAVARLSVTTVRLLGDAALVASMARTLEGVCEVVLDDVSPTLTQREVVVFLETEESAAALSVVHQHCWATRTPLLRVNADAERMVVGPFVDAAFTPCLDCSRAAESAMTGMPSEESVDLIAGLAARELLAMLTRSLTSTLPADSSEIRLRDLTTQYHPATTLPGCPTCSFSEGPTASAPPLATVYEAGVAIPPRQFVDEKGHQAHYKSSNLELQFSFREWPSCPRSDLPEPDLDALVGGQLGGQGRSHVHPPSLRDLATVLAVANGVKTTPDPSAKLRRWTAAGGNLGSTTAYVVCREPGLLEPGTYAYLERDHTLARVSDLVPPGEGPLSVVFTGNVGKVARKYGAFALRIALQDSGCALASAREVARGIGLSFAVRSDWDDHPLHEACATLPDREPVMAVLDLGGADAY